MEATDFIHNELNSFIRRFSRTRIRYQYDETALIHIVEVLPNEIYHLDSEYIKWEDDFYNRFVSQFPCENICFISDDALVEITAPELVLEGLEYAPITFAKGQVDILDTVSINLDSTCFVIPFHNQNQEYDFGSLQNTSVDDNILMAA